MGEGEQGRLGWVRDGGMDAGEKGNPPMLKNVEEGLFDNNSTSSNNNSMDSSSGESESSSDSTDSSSESNESEEDLTSVPAKADEVRNARRRFQRNYYLLNRGRWERGELDDETWLQFGADSDCSFFDES